MKGPDGFVQGYNAQIAVEPVLQLIVGQALTQQENDKKQLLPMIDAVRQQSGQRVREVLADSGYCSEDNLRQAAKKKIDLYVATEKNKHNQPAQPTSRGRIPKSATLVERMKRKLRTKAGRAIYAGRKTIVEPVFGQIKQARGFRQFLLRGVEKVRSRMGAGMHHAQSAEAAPPDYRLNASKSDHATHKGPMPLRILR